MEHPYEEKIQRMKERMDSGVSFAEAAVETGLFSALHSKMLKIGQQTGSMDTVMHRDRGAIWRKRWTEGSAPDFRAGADSGGGAFPHRRYDFAFRHASANGHYVGDRIGERI